MTACASLPALNNPLAGPEPRPLVLIDGVPAPELSVRQFSVTGPLDQRTAVIVNSSRGLDEGGLDNPKLTATATLILPLRLIDGQVRALVLTQGQMRRSNRRIASAVDEELYELDDQWNEVLNEPVPALWQTPNRPLIDHQGSSILELGSKSNRSELRRNVNGQLVYVLQEAGLSWSVRTALDMIFALIGVDVSTAFIPSDIAVAPLVKSIDLGRPLHDGLLSILEPYGLVIRREMIREGGAVIANAAVRPAGLGVNISLTWAAEGRALGRVLKITTDRPADLAEPWVAEGSGWVVESTFDLVQGWDSLLEGQADSVYQRDNDQFSRYINVYRLWALNEDGWFTPSPFEHGPAFDLTDFFNGVPVRPQPLRFLRCVTLNDIGEAAAPIVEMSLDGGSTWNNYSGSTVIRTDRAAVYLDDDILPSGFFSAAKTGQARLRVTASLQSPVPVRVLRWRGNPFAGVGPQRTFDLGNAFQFRRVAVTSIHFSGVSDGTLAADSVDQTSTLNDWLIARMRREDLAGDVNSRGQAKLKLAGVWPLLRPGDRLINVGGDGIDAAGRSEAIAQRGSVVQSLVCRWSSGNDAAGVADASTAVDLTF